MAAFRLRAPSEDPAAFGSTFEREIGVVLGEWRARTGEPAPFVVEADDRPPTRRQLP